MQNFENIRKTAKSLDAIYNKQLKLKNEASALRASVKKQSKNAIEDMTRQFCHEMSNPLALEAYIVNQHKSSFTEYVNRKGVSLSGRHRDARKKFTAAWRELNESLALVARDDPENFIRQVVRHSGLKNLTNGE